MELSQKQKLFPKQFQEFPLKLWELDRLPQQKLHLQRANLSLDEIGLIELNEAFAAQSIAVIRELNLDLDRVNVNGGAIALGHPLGATGSILMTKLFHEMERRDVKYGFVTLCIGGGQGITTF